MKVPEKIYRLITTGDLWLNGYHEYKPAKIRYNDKIIEYIRKDIVDEMLATAEDHAYFAGSESQREKLEKIKDDFIEKACEYLQINLWRVVNEEPDFRQRFVTDFRNYIKGE